MRGSTLEIMRTTPVTNHYSEAIDHRINKVMQLISALSIELKELQSQQNTKKKRNTKKRDGGDRSNIEVDRTTRDGSRCAIKSDHKNCKGLAGIIIRKTQCQAVVRTISGEF